MRRAGFRLAGIAVAVAVLVAVAGMAHAASPFGIATPNSPGAGFGGPLGPLFVRVAYYQSIFYRGLTQALTDIKANGWAVWLLLSLSFAYGVFHAAGPGHGKAVISAYMISSGETAKRGIALSFMAAFVQAVSAVVIVGVAAIDLPRHRGHHDQGDRLVRDPELRAGGAGRRLAAVVEDAWRRRPSSSSSPPPSSGRCDRCRA